MRIALLLLVAGLLSVPAASAHEDDSTEICVDMVCVQACFSALGGACVDPEHPTHTLKDVQKWFEELIGPCICDPDPDPW